MVSSPNSTSNAGRNLVIKLLERNFVSSHYRSWNVGDIRCERRALYPSRKMIDQQSTHTLLGPFDSIEHEWKFPTIGEHAITIT